MMTQTEHNYIFHFIGTQLILNYNRNTNALRLVTEGGGMLTNDHIPNMSLKEFKYASHRITSNFITQVGGMLGGKEDCK